MGRKKDWTGQKVGRLRRRYSHREWRSTSLLRIRIEDNALSSVIIE
jgi:hypothetical protein